LRHGVDLEKGTDRVATLRKRHTNRHIVLCRVLVGLGREMGRFYWCYSAAGADDAMSQTEGGVTGLFASDSFGESKSGAPNRVTDRGQRNRLGMLWSAHPDDVESTTARLCLHTLVMMTP
jgi:hypothetical protein